MDTRRDFIYVEDLVDLRAEGRRWGPVARGRITSPLDRTTRSRSSTTRPSRLSDATISKIVEVRPRNPDDATAILLDPSETERDFDWRVTTPRSRSGVARGDWLLP